MIRQVIIISGKKNKVTKHIQTHKHTHVPRPPSFPPYITYSPFPYLSSSNSQSPSYLQIETAGARVLKNVCKK